jgi:hypothetical protein
LKNHANGANESRGSIGRSLFRVSRQSNPAAGTVGNQPGPKSPPINDQQTKRDMCIAQPVDASRTRCGFSSHQMIVVRIMKDHALRDCSRAISAVNTPGNEEEVKRIGKDYFGGNLSMTDRNRRALVHTIALVSDKLERAPIECATCQDERCNNDAVAFVDNARTRIFLCPQFFNPLLVKPFMAPRALIHEAAHLANLDRNASIREEFYCHQGATKDEKCPVIDPLHNVDAWSYFIQELAYTI